MINIPTKEHFEVYSPDVTKMTSNTYAPQNGLALDDIYGADSFRQHTNLILSKLSDYLEDDSLRGLELKNPYQLLRSAVTIMERSTTPNSTAHFKKLEAIIDLYIKTGIQVYSPSAMGRQFSGTIPLAAIIDLVSSIISQPSSFYEAGQLPNIVERIMADEFNQFIGWDDDEFAMITTSGGTLGNMTALLAARNDRYPNVWSSGMSNLNTTIRPAIAISEDAHYSISRAVGILGIGSDQVVRLPINKKRQIDITKVRGILAKAKQDGLDVFCLVASAGSTSVGAIDPIDELGTIAQERNIWLHVDGAHGASLLVSDQQRPKLKGIEKADSFVWDAHKVMFVPAVCTLLFYKNKEKSYGAFQQEASYVFEKEPDVYTQFDSAKQNFECTKRPLIMNLWVLWSMYGRSVFENKVDYACQFATKVYHILKTEPDFETIHQPQANILCFRYIPFGHNNIKDFQVAIRNKIKKDGEFFISKVDIDGEPALRVVFANHKITINHFQLLLQKIRSAGQAIIQQHIPGTPF